MKAEEDGVGVVWADLLIETDGDGSGRDDVDVVSERGEVAKLDVFGAVVRGYAEENHHRDSK